MSGPEPGWGGQEGNPDPTRAFPAPGPWTGAQPGPVVRPQWPGPEPLTSWGGPPSSPRPEHQQPKHPQEPYYGQHPPPFGPPPGPPPGGSGGGGRGPLIGAAAAVLVLLVVLGTVLLVRSRSSPDNTATGATSTAPPLPSSLAPSSSTLPSPTPSTTPPATLPTSSTNPPSTTATTADAPPANPADVGAITALSQRLIEALNTGDVKQIEAVTCGTLRTQAEKGAKPPEKTITYDRTEDVMVDGDTGSAKVYASDDDTEPTPATMQVQRVDGTWKACNLS